MLLPDGTGGYVLDGWGGLAPVRRSAITRRRPRASAGYWNGRGIIAGGGVSIMPDGTGGYVLDGFGGLHPFAIGTIRYRPPRAPGYWQGWDIAPRHHLGSVTAPHEAGGVKPNFSAASHASSAQGRGRAR